MKESPIVFDPPAYPSRPLEEYRYRTHTPCLRCGTETRGAMPGAAGTPFRCPACGLSGVASSG